MPLDLNPYPVRRGDPKGIRAILLDQDGPLADFVGGVARCFGVTRESLSSQYAIAPSLGITRPHLWRVIDSEGPGFWRELEETPVAAQLVSHCQDYLGDYDAVSILTKTPCIGGRYAGEGKRWWLRSRQWEVLPHLHITSCKASLMPTSAHVLIDDSDEEVTAWRAVGGSAILFPAPWNSARDHIHEQMQVVMAELDIISSHLIEKPAA